jgi:hypothetical protein
MQSAPTVCAGATLRPPGLGPPTVACDVGGGPSHAYVDRKSATRNVTADMAITRRSIPSKRAMTDPPCPDSQRLQLRTTAWGLPLGGCVVVSTQRSACFAEVEPVVPPGANVCPARWRPRR